MKKIMQLKLKKNASSKKLGEELVDSPAGTSASLTKRNIL